MFGVYFKDKCLVSRSYKEDGIFILIFLLTFILLFSTKKIGKYIHIIYLSAWLIVQILAHEWYSIFGRGVFSNSLASGKIYFFRNTIKVFHSSSVYYPDLYHIILHILILLALISTIRFKRLEKVKIL